MKRSFGTVSTDTKVGSEKDDDDKIARVEKMVSSVQSMVDGG